MGIKENFFVTVTFVKKELRVFGAIWHDSQLCVKDSLLFPKNWLKKNVKIAQSYIFLQLQETVLYGDFVTFSMTLFWIK